jgi:hypothetical protein
VAVGKRGDVAVADDEDPENLTLTQEGYHHHAPHVVAPVDLTNAPWQIRIPLDIRNGLHRAF